MQSTQLTWTNRQWLSQDDKSVKPQLVLLFGSRRTIEDQPEFYDQLRAKFPDASIMLSSTAGNIIGDSLMDESIVATAIEFEKTSIKAKLFPFVDDDAHLLGTRIVESMKADDLAYVLLLSCAGMNAGKLLAGINEGFEDKVPVSGGIAGDNTEFERTLVGLDENIGTDQLVAVGFYGKDLKCSHSSKGGWDRFGPKRTVTKCEGNVLYEIDGRPALDLYKKYLGPQSKELPASGLRFPFAVYNKHNDEYVVRGIQNIDEEKNALILFSDLHDGDSVQLMMANFDRVIDGAGQSASEAIEASDAEPELALLISCIARRLVLDQLTEEELESAKKSIGEQTTICGFYSYSEISPLVGENACLLHNQSMTITMLSEK